MRRSFLSKVGIFHGVTILIMALALAGPAAADESVYKGTLPATAWVVSDTSQGSGALVDREKKLVATNFHVVGLQTQVKVIFPEVTDGRVVAERQHYRDNLARLGITGKVVARDPKRDLALIQLERLPEHTPALELAAESATPGQRVHSIGNPGASDALWVYSTGTVRQIYVKHFVLHTGQCVEARVLETQTPINPGDSGGPVVNDEGKLVGLVSAFKQGASMIGLCIDASELRSLLQGEIKSIDAKLRQTLGDLQLKHTINPFGVFRLEYRLTERETHSVFVDSHTEPVGRVRVREIWSPAHGLDTALPADVANSLLRSNQRFRIGAWETRTLQGRDCVVFCARVPADLDAESLRATIGIVLRAAAQEKKQLVALETSLQQAGK